MARKRTSTFFLRADQNINDDNVFYEGEIDLGAYVNVLDKAVLSIKSIQCAYTGADGQMPNIQAGEAAAAQWQLTTQSQSTHVLISDKSVVASGLLTAFEQGSSTIATIPQEFDVGPNAFRTDDGYFVATESLYLGGSATSKWAEEVTVSLILECQVVTMDVQDGVALALSQQ